MYGRMMNPIRREIHVGTLFDKINENWVIVSLDCMLIRMWKLGFIVAYGFFGAHFVY